MIQIRDAIPARRQIYWIQDNLSANWTPDIRAFAAGHRIELVPTPTYASYLNPVECHFLPISEFVVNNADYVDWDASPGRSPATSATATDRTATSASASSKPVTRSPPDAVSGQTFREGPLVRTGDLRFQAVASCRVADIGD